MNSMLPKLNLLKSDFDKAFGKLSRLGLVVSQSSSDRPIAYRLNNGCPINSNAAIAVRE